MNLNKVKLSDGTTHKLRLLKGRTGLTPNILCRLGFCLSLNEPGIPDGNQYQDDGMEFNRYTLTGQWDTLFVALLQERCIEDGINLGEDLAEQFRAHLNRGVLLIYNRVKTLVDLGNLMSQ